MQDRDYPDPLTRRSSDAVIAEAVAESEAEETESELFDEEQDGGIDGYAIPDEPESYGRSNSGISEQISLFSSDEKTPPESQEIEAGDVLLINNKNWRVNKIDGDFAIWFDNTDPEDTEAAFSMIGHFVGDFDNNGNIHTCMWCEAPDDELFEVIFDAYSDFGAYYNG